MSNINAESVFVYREQRADNNAAGSAYSRYGTVYVCLCVVVVARVGVGGIGYTWGEGESFHL